MEAAYISRYFAASMWAVSASPGGIGTALAVATC